MPGGDRTGPMGFGPMTGRGAGWCSGAGRPGFANPAGGRGMGRGRGFFGGGFGRRQRFFATGVPGRQWFGGDPYAGGDPFPINPDPDAERQALKNQAASLREELDAITRRLEALEGGAAEE